VPTSVAHYEIAEIGGDGIGPVVAEAVRVLDAVAGVPKALREPGARTRDTGGIATTRAAGEAVIRAL
jgi:isocitrate/isopropylmalate dehydrogenase